MTEPHAFRVYLQRRRCLTHTNCWLIPGMSAIFVPPYLLACLVSELWNSQMLSPPPPLNSPRQGQRGVSATSWQIRPFDPDVATCENVRATDLFRAITGKGVERRRRVPVGHPLRISGLGWSPRWPPACWPWCSSSLRTRSAPSAR